MIRFKVFLPALLIVLLVSWFVLYKLDWWVKGSLESSLSAITGTKTDITGLDIQLLNSSLEIQLLEIGSSTEEFKNAVEFERIMIDFQTIPLLQKRFVVDEFSVTGIAWGTPRKTSAKLPPQPKEEPSWISEQMDEALDSLKTEFNNLPVAKLADFKLPNSPADLLKQVNLDSEGAFKESIATAQSLKSDWTDELKSLRDISEYKRRITEARQLVRGAPNNPQEILRRVKTIQEFIEFFKKERERVNALAIRVRSDFEKVTKQYQSAVAAVDADYQRAVDLISLDQLNVDNLSRLIFGAQWVGRAENVLRMQRALQAKLNQLKDEDDSVEVRQRAQGRDIIFLKVREEPQFILAKSDFSVKNLKNGDRGEVSQLYEVSLRDINSAPSLYREPTTVDLKMSMKEGPFAKASLSAYIDHVKEESVDKFDLRFEKINAASWPMGVPRYFPLKISKGMAKAKMDLDFVDSMVSWENQIKFRRVEWDFSEITQSGIVIRAIERVLKDVKAFTLKIGLRFKEGRFSYEVTSDLDAVMANAINKVIGEELQNFKRRVRTEIDKRLNEIKKKALSEKQAFENEIRTKVSDYQKTLRDYENEARNLVKQLQSKAESAAKQKAKEKAEEQIKKAVPKDLKKKLKLPNFP